MARRVLCHCVSVSLVLFSLFMLFLTEELWQRLHLSVSRLEAPCPARTQPSMELPLSPLQPSMEPPSFSSAPPPPSTLLPPLHHANAPPHLEDPHPPPVTSAVCGPEGPCTVEDILHRPCAEDLPRPSGSKENRPVALTSHIMKTLEGLVLEQLRPMVGPLLAPLQLDKPAGS